MDYEKVDLCENAASYAIEVDVGDLNVGESLAARYERYVSVGRFEEAQNVGIPEPVGEADIAREDGNLVATNATNLLKRENGSASSTEQLPNSLLTPEEIKSR